MSKSFYDSFAKKYDEWIKADSYAKDIKQFYSSFFKNYFLKPTQLVEFGIGTGNIALEILCNTKHSILGVDNSLSMLDICKEKITKNIELLEDDIYTLKFTKNKEAIYLPYRTLCHFISSNEKKHIIQNIYNNLKKDGIFVFDLDVMSQRQRIYFHNKPHLFYQNLNTSVYHKYDFKSETEAIEVSVFIANNKTKDVEIFKYDFSWIEVSQVKQILDEVGFKVLHLYGDPCKNEYSSTSDNQIWVVQK